MTEWPADRVERRSINDLLPRAGNPRAHPEWQIKQIAESIQQWGWTIPILIDEDGNVIAGHGRIMAALRLDIADAPCMIARGWSEAQKRAYVIADNKLAQNSDWDRQMLTEELKALDADSLIAFTGFSEGELLSLINDPAVNDPNAAWTGMPEFSQQDQLGFRRLIVHFVDAAAVDDFCEKIGQAITDKTKMIWYPKQVHLPIPTDPVS